MGEMIPIIADTNFNRIAEIDNYSSFIWTTRYYNCGDFELCVPANVNNFDLFKKDYYIMRNDDDHTGIIEKIDIQRNEDGKETLIISGRFLSSILERRIIAVQTQINDTISNGIYKLIDDAVINPAIAERKISNFTRDNYTTSEKMSAQYTGKNLLDTISDICKTYGLGFKTTLTDDNKFYFQLFEGVDRSYNQAENPFVIFSDQYDNLLSSEYKEDYTAQVTNVLVAGEGEGLDRKTLWVTTENPSGLARREMYKDQRNLQSNDGEISESEYMAQMKEDGLESISKITQAFSGGVDFNSYRWKTDINIGDVCTIENTKLGIYINSRLIEVIESTSEAGEYSITPTFGA